MECLLLSDALGKKVLDYDLQVRAPTPALARAWLHGARGGATAPLLKGFVLLHGGRCAGSVPVLSNSHKCGRGRQATPNPKKIAFNLSILECLEDEAASSDERRCVARHERAHTCVGDGLSRVWHEYAQPTLALLNTRSDSGRRARAAALPAG